MRQPGGSEDAERWDLIEALFHDALEREPGERAAFLDQVCAADEELRAAVEALLLGHREERALDIEDRLLAFESEAIPAEDPLVGSRIGPYHVLRPVGQGGMGDVYLAERDDEHYRQRVALKLVRLGLQTPQVAQRFRAERQILAGLAHPQICRMLDGGVAEDGRPYLVMEYVDGQPLTEYCDRHRLPIEERLRLFRSVCSAVQFAHRNLIVHRDVKPSNVLVTEQGEVKLLDFGIAKLLDAEGTGLSVALTQTVARVMTPDYAAPEQVHGGTITTATDVYALGVLLYELLVGRRPYRLERRTLAEIERIVSSERPPWPSEAVTTGEEVATPGGTSEVRTPDQLCAERATDPARLQRALRGDLDNIVMMALRKEPERRYGSAEQLAEDIDRYLGNRPVIARKDTFGYRLRKFVRRNRAGVAVATAGLVLVLGFAVAMTLQARELARERDRARLEASTATQVTEFLEELFEAPDPFAGAAGRKEAPSVEELVLRGAGRVQDELAGQPAVQARLLNVLGGVFRNLGDLERARRLLEQSVEILRDPTVVESAASGSAELAESLSDLAFLLLDLQAHDEAERLLLEAQRSAQEGGHQRILYTTIKGLGHLMQNRGELDAAEAHYRNALELSQELYSGPHPEIAGSMANLATVLTRKADFDAAEPLLRDALEVYRQTVGSRHPLVATALNNLGYLLLDAGEVDEAVSLHREAVELRRELFEPPHPQLASALNNLGAALWQLGELEEAAGYYRESLAMRRELYGERHPAVASALNNLAQIEARVGDLQAAESMLREAGAILGEALGEHPAVATVTHNLAVNLHGQGDHEAASALFLEALEIRRDKLPQAHPATIATRLDLGRCLTELGQYDEAERLLQASFEVLEASREEQEGSWRKVLERLAALYRAKDEPEEAARFEALIP